MANNSPRVLDAQRQALALVARQPSQPGGEPGAPPTTARVGFREVDKATGAKTKGKYGFWIFRFGPKVTTFTTEKVKLPVYKENDREKRYFSAVKQTSVASIQNSGFKTVFGGNGNGSVSTPLNVGQFNSRGHIYFFNKESNARVYGKNNVDGDYAIIEFVMPEDQEFTPDPESGFSAEKLSETQALRTNQDIPANCIKQVHFRNRVGS